MADKIIYELYLAPAFKPVADGPMDTYRDAEVYIQELDVIGGGDFIMTEKKVEDQVYYIKEIKSPIKVSKIGYEYLFPLACDCSKFWVKVYKTCNGVNTFLYRTFFNMNNVKFDSDTCQCEIDLQYTSMYNCIADNRGNTQELHLNNVGDVIPFQISFPLGDLYYAVDLRKVVEQLIKSMNCAGYENDQLYNCAYPISDFFNWQQNTYLSANNPGTGSLMEQYLYNGVYAPLTPIPNYVNPGDDPYNIAIALKSNILTPDPLPAGGTNPGTTYTLSFSEIEKVLRDVFNVYWCLVPNETLLGPGTPATVVANWLRFEHFSWFTKTANYDAISATNFPLNRNKNKFQVNADDFPYSEEWVFSDHYGQDFVGMPIKYGTCVGENKIVKRENIRFGTDFDFIINNPSFPFSTDGYFLVDLLVPPGNSGGTGLGLVLNQVFGYLSGTMQANGRLSIANFQYDLHRYNRPALIGEMNGNTETFLSPVYKKIQEAIKVEMCCDDPNQAIESLVTTEMGNGEIVDSEHNFSKGIITFNLKQPC